MPKKLRRGSRKAAKRTSKRKHRKSGKKTSKRLSRNKRRFGSNAEMSISNSYIGMSPVQYNDRLPNIPMSVRSNFYTDIQ